MTKPILFFETENWAVRKHAPIRPAKEFMPEAWKNMPTYTKKATHLIDSDKSVKACPGIGDFMSMGYVIPAWCDIEITPGQDGLSVSTRYSEPNYNSAYHPVDQISKDLLKNFGVRAAVKLDNPWKMWAAEGWTLMYLPMFYFEDRNFEAIPGVIDHDMGALVNPINIMLKEIKPTTIKLGDPLCQVIPIKRETVVARTGQLSDTAVNRHNAISQLKNIVFAGWTRWQHAKKDYVVDAHDLHLPGDTD